MSPTSEPNAVPLRHISLSHNVADSNASALRLIFALFPDWESSEGEVKFTRFTDGITNTLLKATKKRPGLSDAEIDKEAVLLRAYGKDTEILIDREKETASHQLLAQLKLAPPLLARFQNGMLYRFIQGTPCIPEDLRREPVWRGIARRLGQWHAVLPPDVMPTASKQTNGERKNSLSLSRNASTHFLEEINAITPDKLTPNIWTVMQKWIFALPSDTPELTKRRDTLQNELNRTVEELGDLPGLGHNGLVLSHCDLLSGNVIIEPSSPHPNPTTAPRHAPLNETETVSFIDYEYCTPGPAAFDLANHFSEWGGFECDFSQLPTRSTRRAFLSSYLASYTTYRPQEDTPKLDSSTAEQQLAQLFSAVDKYRGVPGLYWGVWALIQAQISQIDFDYASYAEIRLSEYWDWRAEESGKREAEGRPKGVREARWAEE